MVFNTQWLWGSRGAFMSSQQSSEVSRGVLWGLEMVPGSQEKGEIPEMPYHCGGVGQCLRVRVPVLSRGSPSWGNIRRGAFIGVSQRC